MKLRWFFRRAVVLLAGLVFLLPAASASAHGHVMVGDYELEIGFRNEPALQDELNGLELAVQNTKTSGPVTGLEDTLQAEIIFGASSRVLKIEPVPDEDGAYTAAFIPSEVGDYTWHIFGKIEDTPVDVSMTSSPTTFELGGAARRPILPRRGSLADGTALASAARAGNRRGCYCGRGDRAAAGDHQPGDGGDARPGDQRAMIAAARRAGRVRRVMRRAAASFLLGGLLAWLALPVVPVQAHAQLLSSNPAPGQVLDSFPGVAELSFSETLDMRTARAQLHNASGELIAEGKLRLDPAKPRTLLVDLPKQPDGVYSLDWRVVSAVDGHDTSGTIAFSVGLSSPKASLLAPPGTPDPAADLPPGAEVILRGLAYGCIALLLGSALFAVLVWRPAYSAAFAAANAEAFAAGQPPDGSLSRPRSWRAGMPG